MSKKQEILDKLEKLEQKYEAMGQDLNAYLEGLLYADYLTYWDYIHLDTLLSLQTPKTSFKDETIFIGYHQITELYFKLILWELEQIAEEEITDINWFHARIGRVIRYFEVLASSFDIMVDGMEREQFLKFRMSLLPSSGFQSGQFRMIEFYATELANLVANDKRESLQSATKWEELYDAIYWKQGGLELRSGKKTLTLRQFETKYNDTFESLCRKNEHSNVYSRYKALKKNGKANDTTRELLRTLDRTVNVDWRLSHFKSAAKYLKQDPKIIEATGGTNWQKYLPPRFQHIIFFPELWSEEEINTWGSH